MSSGGDEQRAASVGHVSLSKGRNGIGNKKGSRFLELKSNVVDGLKNAHLLIEQQSNTASLAPKVSIVAQTEIRGVIRQAYDEWNELYEIYKKEMRKKKSSSPTRSLLFSRRW